MTVLGIPIFILITLLPGFFMVRLLLRKSCLFDAILYAVGLGVAFNIVVGAVADIAFGISLLSVALVYISLLLAVGVLSLRFGRGISFRWSGMKGAAIPAILYVLALVLQLQTTLISPNLVGSDIHLEYFISNLVLEQGVWNPMYMGTTLNACLGLTLLLPVYKLMTGMTLMMVFKVVCPMVFAIVPVVLYRIYKPQFGAVASALAVVFFVSMPMFTMDMVQLVRQQQSELFFVLLVLAVMDEDLGFRMKVAAGAVFGIGVMVTHLGLAIGMIGYLLAGSVIAVVLARMWRHKIGSAVKPMVFGAVLACLAVVSVGLYAGYYGWVSNGWMSDSAVAIPMQIVESTAQQAVGDSDTAASLSFLNPLNKEPLAQTALGMDFGRASLLGKIWRVLQYLVEICLAVGLFKLLAKPLKSLRLEYMAFVVASGFVILGLYLLSNYGWGLGTARVWEITLLFMSPMVVVGVGAIGRWATGMRRAAESRIAVFGFLALFLPYFAFNSGAVFEMAKLEPKGFIDVPYSIALSGHRVDVASIFTEQDVEAMDWLKAHVLVAGGSGISEMIYGDTHSGSLAVQRIGSYLDKWGRIDRIGKDDAGYIFLRKWNVDNNKLTAYGDYGARQSFSIDGYPIVKQKIDAGTVVFDNGARVILVVK